MKPLHTGPGRCVIAVLLAFAVSWNAAAVVERLSFSFDDAVAGYPPQGFFFAAARQAAPGVWEVRGTGTRRHLLHIADPSVTMRGISVAGVTADAPANIKLSTRLRLVDGDLAGGLMWRYRDANNFYFFSVVLVDRAARLVRVTGGNRILLDEITDVNLSQDDWHSMGLVHDGDQIRATINGIGVLRARDATLTGGGHAGIWSAGNSTTWFDDLVIEDAPD